MRTKFHLATLVVGLFTFASTAEAKITETPAANFGIADMMSFETEDTSLWGAKGWWAQNANEGQINQGMWVRTDAQAADGTYSLKCEMPQLETNTQPAIQTETVVANERNTVQLEADKSYRLKFKIYIDGTQNKGLSELQVSFSEELTAQQKADSVKGDWIDKRFKTLDSLDKDGWVTLSTDFTAKSSNVYKMVIKPIGSDCTEQGVLFYVDQLELFETTVTQNTGFGDEDMMSFEITDAKDPADGPDGAAGWWANPNDGCYFSRTTDKAHLGEASMLIDIPSGTAFPDGTTLIQTDEEKLENESIVYADNAPRIAAAGDYVFRRYVWIDPSCNSGLTQIMNILSLIGKWQVAPINTTGLAKGEWVQVDTDLTFDKAYTGKLIIKLNQGAAATDAVKVYMDDFQLLTKGQVTSIGSASDTQLSAYAQGESIVVRFAPVGELVEVYNLSGVRVASQVVTGATTAIDVTRGIYIIKAGSEVLKVVK